MQSIEFIPFILAMVHLNASFYSFRIPTNLLLYLSSREDEMIVGKVFSSIKNAYFKVSGNGLSSSFDNASDGGLSFFPDGASCSILAFHLLASMNGDESCKALTSSIDLSILQSKLKWVKHIYKDSSLRLE